MDSLIEIPRAPRSRAFGAALAVAGASLALMPASAQANGIVPPADAAAFQTDGPVNAIARGGGLTFIGGQFTELSARTGPGLRFDPATGRRVPPVAEVSGGGERVIASAPDGSGGYFIGGDFTHVGGVPRKNVAHILADGSVDPAFDPNVNGLVRALAVSGGALYAGGGFTRIDGLVRNRIAKLSATSGNAFSGWNPNANGLVNALAVSGSDVYVGGSFDGTDSIGGEDRNRIAKLSATSGNAFSGWDPNSNFPVDSLAVSGSEVYVGGGFGNIGGLDRSRIAKLSAITGNAFSSWDPDADIGSVHALAVSGSEVYAGGTFGNIGGLDRSHIAKLSATSGNAFSGWNPTADNVVLTLAISGSEVYAGGFFGNIGGQPRNRIAKLSATSGNSFSSFDPNIDPDIPCCNSDVRTLALSGSTVFAGGGFATVNPVPRTNIAALDSTGAPTAFNPGVVNGPVVALAADSTALYAGGDFTQIGGEDRARIAKLSPTSGNAFSAWNPDANDTVIDLALSGAALYVGGEFDENGADNAGANEVSIGGQIRNRIAKLSTSSGNAFSGWNPNLNGAVFSLAVQDSAVYAGGFFTNVGGLPRNALAKLSATSGNPFSGFNPGTVNGPVVALAVDSTAVFAGGDFSEIGGQTRNNIAKLSPTSGNAFSAWNPNANDFVSALALDGSGSLYAGGGFNGATSIGLQSRNRIAKLSATSGNAFELFNPDADAPVRALAASGPLVHAGGDFTTIGGGPRQGFAQFNGP